MKSRFLKKCIFQFTKYHRMYAFFERLFFRERSANLAQASIQSSETHIHPASTRLLAACDYQRYPARRGTLRAAGFSGDGLGPGARHLPAFSSASLRSAAFTNTDRGADRRPVDADDE